MTQKIMTSFREKPVPSDEYDWCAQFDGAEPGDPVGFGSTEQAACDDLLYNVT